MARSIVSTLFASALAILSSLALLASAMVVSDVPLTLPVDPAAGRVVHSFYAAINDVLRTGESAALDRVASPDLTVHDPTGMMTIDRGQFLRHLLGLRAVHPGLQLTVVEMIVVGDRAMVQLTLADNPRGTFLGLHLGAPHLAWGHIDVLAISGGQLTRLWSVAAVAPRLEESLTLPLAAPLVPDHGDHDGLAVG